MLLRRSTGWAARSTRTERGSSSTASAEGREQLGQVTGVGADVEADLHAIAQLDEHLAAHPRLERGRRYHRHRQEFWTRLGLDSDVLRFAIKPILKRAEGHIVLRDEFLLLQVARAEFLDELQPLGRTRMVHGPRACP